MILDEIKLFILFLMQEGTKKTIIWETNSEPPRNYIWVKHDGVPYEYDNDIREWVPSRNIGPGSGTNVIVKTTAEWDAEIGYIPAEGEIIVYSDYQKIEVEGEMRDVPGIKIGSGNAYVQDLMFVAGISIDVEELEEKVDDHILDNSVHTNSEERAFWNNKVSIDESELDSEILIFKNN